MHRTRTTIGIIVAPLIIAGLLYAAFDLTDPLTLGPGGILGVFILLYLECLTVLFVLLRFGMYWFLKLMKLRGTVTTRGMMTEKKAYYVASVLAFAPVILLAMHAYSQLKLPDIILVAVFMAVVTFYIVKRR